MKVMSRSIDQRRVKELLDMSDAELEAMYGVEIWEDCVYDPVEDREFNTLEEWAEYVVSQEEADSSFVKRAHKYDFDDE